MTTTKPPQVPTVRTAGASDVDAVVHLLRMRDDLEHPASAIADYLMNLEASRLVAWVAYVDDRPVGLNTLYLRQMRWCGKTQSAGYWAHLFVDPNYRKRMIYPQLVVAMIRGAREAGLDLIYTGTRRRQVAEAHAKIGFSQIGTLPVLFKPLRPGRLIAKHKNLGRVVETLTVPGDALYGKYLALRRPRRPTTVDVETLNLESPTIDDVAQKFDDAGKEHISQRWDSAYFRRRFSTTIEGLPYTILTAHASGRLTATIVFRMAERGDRRIRAGVIMDVLGASQAPAAAAALLAESERQVMQAGGEVMLYLDGTGEETHRLLTAAGYRTSPETYYILVWPKNLAAPDCPAADLANWRFAFSDHDAF